LISEIWQMNSNHDAQKAFMKEDKKTSQEE
jgi:hypothetical protein